MEIIFSQEVKIIIIDMNEGKLIFNKSFFMTSALIWRNTARKDILQNLPKIVSFDRLSNNDNEFQRYKLEI